MPTSHEWNGGAPVNALVMTVTVPDDIEEVLFPIPLIGEYDGDDTVVNDALAPGSIGWANDTPGVGLVAPAAQCRSYNGDGSPDL